MTEIIEVTEHELSEYLNVSDRRIRQLAKDGIAIKVKKGRYDLKQSISNYINFIKSNNKNNNETLEKLKISKQAEELMHEKLKKRKTELLVLQMEKKLHSAEDVESIWNTMIFAAKSKITSIPTKVAPVLVGIEDAKEIQSILRREINDVLNDIANYDVSKFDKDFEEEYYATNANERNK